MEKLRIGVAGLGRIGWSFHCRSIGESRDFELAAVADTDADRRSEAAETYGCETFETFEDMVDGAGLDAAVIATPTHLHKQHALAAFGKGLHVYLEKPMAMTLDEAEAIVAEAKRAGRVLTVYQPHRARAYFQHAMRIARSGRIGEIYHVRRGLFNYVRRNDWQALLKYGGGMLNNYGAHCLDQVLFMTGYNIRQIMCSLRRVATLGDAEDVVKVAYETSEGMVGEVDINQACTRKPYEFEIYGTQGVLAKEGNELVSRSFDKAELAPKELDESLASADRKYPRDDIPVVEHREEINPEYDVDVYADFAKAIRVGSRPLVHPEESFNVMKVMQQCREAAGQIRDTRL